MNDVPMIVVILGLLVVGAIGAGLLFVGFHVVKFLAKCVGLVLPTLGGAVGFIGLAQRGHGGFGVLAIFAGIVANYFWWNMVYGDLFKSPSPSSSSDDRDWKDDLIKTYDADGRHTGYKDRE
jgi:hypothetical protein